MSCLQVIPAINSSSQSPHDTTSTEAVKNSLVAGLGYPTKSYDPYLNFLKGGSCEVKIWVSRSFTVPCFRHYFCTFAKQKTTMSCLQVILAIIFPPLAVIDRGCGSMLIVFLLTLCGWVPGVIAALIILNKNN